MGRILPRPEWPHTLCPPSARAPLGSAGNHGQTVQWPWPLGGDSLGTGPPKTEASPPQDKVRVAPGTQVPTSTSPTHRRQRGGRPCEPQSGKTTATTPESHPEDAPRAEGSAFKFNTQTIPPRVLLAQHRLKLEIVSGSLQSVTGQRNRIFLGP